MTQPQTLKNLTARLAAVQALYQASYNKESSRDLVEEYLKHRTGMEFEGETVADMDGALFKRVAGGVLERSEDIDALIDQTYKSNTQDIEPLLKAIMMCGAYELMAHTEVDAPIILNDYINITGSFYSDSEKSLVNGILDSLRKSLRV